VGWIFSDAIPDLPANSGETQMNCRKCGAPIRNVATTGRPRRFCSLACRRAAEVAVRRLDRNLEALEATYLRERFNSSEVKYMSDLRTRSQYVNDLEKAIAEAEGRLKMLLEALEGEMDHKEGGPS
jgi:hypothetical protein